VVDASGDAHLHGAGTTLDAGAAAGGARVLDDLAPAPALGARLAEGEVALVVVEHAAPATARAGDRRGAGARAAAVAGGAGGVGREVDLGRDPSDRVEERQVQVGLEVLPALGARAAPAAPPTGAREQPAEQVA